MKIAKESFDKIQKLAHAYIDERGKEVLNPIPKELAAGFDRPPTLQERIQRAIAMEISRNAALQEYETIADASMFDLDDEMSVRISGYEYEDIPPMGDDDGVPPPVVTDPEPEPDPSPDPEPDGEKTVT